MDGDEEKWAIRRVENGGKNCLLRSNASLRRLEKFPYRIGIAVPIDSAGTDGTITAEENEQLQGVEEAILRILDEKPHGVLCCVVTGGGMKEYMLYVESDDTELILSKLRRVFPDRGFQGYATRDPDWGGYRSLDAVE